MRLGLSQRAVDLLAEARLRRFVTIELNGQASLAPSVSGPLDDNVVHVWVDLPTPITVLIEVRAPGKPVARRLFSIAGLTSDVAARVVAIAVAENVRDQTAPARPQKKPPAPKAPTPEEMAQRDRFLRAIAFGAAASGVVLPAARAGMVGPALSIAFREHGASAGLFARYLGGSGAAGSMRWVEAGLGADYRISLGSRFRLGAGIVAAGSVLHLSDATEVDHSSDRDAWSARAGGMISIDARVSGPAWLGLAFEPGAMLRPVPFADATGARGVLEGAWIGLDLRLTLEAREPRPRVPAPAL